MTNRWNKRPTRKERSQWLSNLGGKPCNSVKLCILFRWIIHIVERKLQRHIHEVNISQAWLKGDFMSTYRCFFNVLGYLGIHETGKQTL